MRIGPRSLRGRVLWLFGWTFGLVGGISYLGTALPAVTKAYLAFPLAFAPAWVYGWLFVAVGAFAIVSSYWPGDHDRLGYVASATLAGVWATTYVCGWAFYGAPPRAIGGAVIWALLSALLVTCARIPSIYVKPKG